MNRCTWCNWEERREWCFYHPMMWVLYLIKLYFLLIIFIF